MLIQIIPGSKTAHRPRWNGEAFGSNDEGHQFERALGRFVVSPAFLVVSLLIFCLVPEKLVKRSERQALAKGVRKTLGMAWMTSWLSRWMSRTEGKRTVMDGTSRLASAALGGVDCGKHQVEMDAATVSEN